TRPGAGKRRPPRSTACGARPTAWSYAGRQPRRSSSVCGRNRCGCRPSTTSNCERLASGSPRSNGPSRSARGCRRRRARWPSKARWGGGLGVAGGTAGAVWRELGARRRALALEVDRLRSNPAAPPPVADPRLVAAGERLVRALAGAGETGQRFEAPLRARVDAGGSRTGDAAGALRELAAREAELRGAAAGAGERAAASGGAAARPLAKR